MHSESLHLLFASGASVAFSLRGYAVVEDDGPAQPVLILNRPIECCSVSIAVKVQDVTAKGKCLRTYICLYVYTYIWYACVCASVCMIVSVVFYRW